MKKRDKVVSQTELGCCPLDHELPVAVEDANDGCKYTIEEAAACTDHNTAAGGGDSYCLI